MLQQVPNMNLQLSFKLIRYDASPTSRFHFGGFVSESSPCIQLVYLSNQSLSSLNRTNKLHCVLWSSSSSWSVALTGFALGGEATVAWGLLGKGRASDHGQRSSVTRSLRVPPHPCNPNQRLTKTVCRAEEVSQFTFKCLWLSKWRTLGILQYPFLVLYWSRFSRNS